MSIQHSQNQQSSHHQQRNKYTTMRYLDKFIMKRTNQNWWMLVFEQIVGIPNILYQSLVQTLNNKKTNGQRPLCLFRNTIRFDSFNRSNQDWICNSSQKRKCSSFSSLLSTYMLVVVLLMFRLSQTDGSAPLPTYFGSQGSLKFRSLPTSSLFQQFTSSKSYMTVAFLSHGAHRYTHTSKSNSIHQQQRRRLLQQLYSRSNRNFDKQSTPQQYQKQQQHQQFSSFRTFFRRTEWIPNSYSTIPRLSILKSTKNSDEDTTVTTASTTTINRNTDFKKDKDMYSMDPIKTVAIVGGTHGNEYTGVWIVRQWEEQQQNQKQTYSSYTITTLIGNPVAHVNNRRFMDVDLNRQFSLESLESFQQPNQPQQQTHGKSKELEKLRAIEINQLLGPKTARPNMNTFEDDEKNSQNNKSNMDLVIDLHSTTAAMDCVIIVPEGDCLMLQAAAYVMHKCNMKHSPRFQKSNNINTNINNSFKDEDENSADKFKTSTNSGESTISFETRILIDHVRSCHSTRPFLPSIGKHEFTIEVGPVPQGVLRHDAIVKTNTALNYLLEFLELYNSNYHNTNPISFGKSNSNNNILSNDHDEVNDTTTIESLTSHTPTTILSLLSTWYPSGVVPCYTDLGKIPWPSHPENPNFPFWVVHKSIQDRDFQSISKGDPFFLSLNGETIYYDGCLGDTIHLGFINEGGYYYSSSGTGIAAFRKTNVTLSTAMLTNS